MAATVIVLKGRPLAPTGQPGERGGVDDDTAVVRVGEADTDQRAGLWHCLRQGQPWVRAPGATKTSTTGTCRCGDAA